MSSWQVIFGVREPAIVGQSMPYRNCRAEVYRLRSELGRAGRMLDDLGLVPSHGFDGMGAEAFAAVVGDLRRCLTAVDQPLTEAGAALGRHADLLEPLRAEANRELGVAEERFNRVNELDREVASARRRQASASRDLDASQLMAEEASAVAAAEQLDEARHRAASVERQLGRANDELAASLRTYDRLRLEEEDLIQETLSQLLSISWPSLASMDIGLGGTGANGSGPIVRAWEDLRPVLLAGGVDVALPGAARTLFANESCTSAQGDGYVLHVGGPRGRDLVVGEDISVEMFDVIQELLAGYIPSTRPFDDVHDLPEDVFSALMWAYSSNVDVGELPQMQVGGINAAWDAYLSGGDYPSQPIRVIDGVALAGRVTGVRGSELFTTAMRGAALGTGRAVVAGELRNRTKVCSVTHPSTFDSKPGTRSRDLGEAIDITEPLSNDDKLANGSGATGLDDS